MASDSHLGYTKIAITLQPIDAMFWLYRSTVVQTEILRKPYNKTANICIKNYCFKHTCNDDNDTGHRKTCDVISSPNWSNSMAPPPRPGAFCLAIFLHGTHNVFFQWWQFFLRQVTLYIWAVHWICYKTAHDKNHELNLFAMLRVSGQCQTQQCEQYLDSSRADKLIMMNCWQVVLSWVATYMSANSSSSQTLRRLTAHTHTHTHSHLNNLLNSFHFADLFTLSLLFCGLLIFHLT